MSEAPERIWAYAGAFKMWRDHKTDRPHTQTEYVRADRIEELEAKLAKAVEAMGCIARQKKTDEFETEYDVEVADFEAGYDTCIDVARATLAELKGEK